MTSSSTNVLTRAFRGGSYLFLQKIFTFIINSFILRHLHLSITGAVTVQFELALATIFLFRDAFRLAFLRMPSLLDTSIDTKKTSTPKQHNRRRQQLINVAWVSTLISWVLACFIAFVVMIRSCEKDTNELQGYTRVLFMYCVAAMIEALAEPMYLVAHSSVLVGWQVTAQGMGFLVRAAAQYTCLFFLHLDGLLSYGVAEIASSMAVLLTFGYLFATRLRDPVQRIGSLQSMSQLLPGHVHGFGQSSAGQPWLDKELAALLSPLLLQSIVKYALTEGDKWVLSLCTTLEQMGIYGIVFHLGSLVPRIIFFPIEEATKTVMSKMANSPSDREHAKRFILVLLKIMHLIGFVFICFGVRYASTLVLVLYGPKKVEAGVGSSLAFYCVYIPFLGLNGICEAFVHAVGNQQQLMRLNHLMIFFFFIYATSAIVLINSLNLQVVGIIIANCINMSCRILYCMTFITSWFHVQSTSTISNILSFWQQALPHPMVLLTFGISFIITSISQTQLIAYSWVHHIVHVMIGLVCFIIVFMTLYVYEWKQLIQNIRQLQHQNKTD